jgi:tRNA (mo5U34)-methyltransferase
MDKEKIKKLVIPLFRTFSPKRFSEWIGERTVLQYLIKNGLLKNIQDKRILEIGPKHGEDSVIIASLNPRELVLLDLPEKDALVRTWLDKIPGKVRYIQGNLLYMTNDELDSIGKFDVVFCLGVLYHNVEQFRLVKKLYDLTLENGIVVVESATTRNQFLRNKNIVELHWPKKYREVYTVTHLPSGLAIKSWMEMVGFKNVQIVKDVYSKTLSKDRSVLIGYKNSGSTPYLSYGSYLPGI